jgi:MFS family permease
VDESRVAAARQLALIAAVQVLVMALWFSTSVVVPQLTAAWRISGAGETLLTSSVQLGFVVGAVGSALLNLADVVPPQRLIALSAVAGAVATAAVALWADGLATAVALRLLTGVALAGVYPVGLKLMATWFARGRGLALGVLVGALTLGSGLPHLVKGVTTLSAGGVLLTSSALALIGAAVAARGLRPGPYGGPSPPVAPGYLVRMFRDPAQRLVNLGYFGHMWELYAMWTWLPAFVAASFAAWSPTADSRLAVGVTSFAVIGIAGAAGCLLGGRLSDRYGRAEVTIGALATSGACCILAAAGFGLAPPILLPVLLLWGAAVIADSAQYSAALTEAADPRYIGTALTAQTALGFLLTIVTIQGLPLLVDAVGWRAAMPALALGPLAGAWAMRSLVHVRGRALGA